MSFGLVSLARLDVNFIVSIDLTHRLYGPFRISMGLNTTSEVEEAFINYN